MFSFQFPCNQKLPLSKWERERAWRKADVEDVEEALEVCLADLEIMGRGFMGRRVLPTCSFLVYKLGNSVMTPMTL